jgi:hypothetical protein
MYKRVRIDENRFLTIYPICRSEIKTKTFRYAATANAKTAPNVMSTMERASKIKESSPRHAQMFNYQKSSSQNSPWAKVHGVTTESNFQTLEKLIHTSQQRLRR